MLEVNTAISQRVYAMSAISSQGDFSYEVKGKAFTGEATVEFLKKLLSKTKEKIMVIWDNASIHYCRVVKEFLKTQRQGTRLHLVRYPTYSPELNPDEQVWHQVKCAGLKNQYYQNIKELKTKVTAELEKLKTKPELIKRFFYEPKVGFYD